MRFDRASCSSGDGSITIGWFIVPPGGDVLGYDLDLGLGHLEVLRELLDRDNVLIGDLARSVDVNELLDQPNTTSTKTRKKPHCNAHALIDKGFDVELSPDRCNVEIIAIAEDLRICDGWAIRS